MQHRELDERKALFRPEVPVKVRVPHTGEHSATPPELRDVVDVTFDGESIIIEVDE